MSSEAAQLTVVRCSLLAGSGDGRLVSGIWDLVQSAKFKAQSHSSKVKV